MPRACGNSAVEGGLEDPVFGSQAIFRQTMDAFAGPGSIVELGERVAAPPPLAPASAAFLAALADYDTPVWLEHRAGAQEAERWIAFQTGAAIVEDAALAAFVVLQPGTDVRSWSRFALGSADYPDRSATLLLPVAALVGGSALRLTGPGIETRRDIAPAGLPSGFVAAMAANAALFPRGVDVLLVCGAQAMALPRTTRIREA